MDSLGAGNLQSGFVLAVILAAVLFADRLGGADFLVRRGVQIAIAVLIAFTVVSGTTAFLRQPDVPPSLESESDSSGSSSTQSQAAEDYLKDVNKRNENANTVHAGIGVIVVVVGVFALRRWRIIPLGWLIGGLLLIIFGGAGTRGSTDASSLLLASYSTLLGSYFGATDRLTDIIHFVVLLVGVVILSLYGYLEWESRRDGASPPPSPDAA